MNISEALAEVDAVVDALGLPIDKPIRYAVAALHTAGIPTSASCGGHLERDLPSPWIRIGHAVSTPPVSKDYPEQVRRVADSLKRDVSGESKISAYAVLSFTDTGNRFDITIDGAHTRIRSLDDMNLDDNQIKENYRFRSVVLGLLQQFYKSRPDTPLDVILTLEEGGGSGDCTLQNMGSLTIGQLGDKAKAAKLERYRQEFDDFGAYLVSL